MIIRSQDKKNIIIFQQVTNLCIHPNHNYSGFRVVVCYPFSDEEDYAHESIGTYSTEEKAIKVLDMIEDAYLNCNHSSMMWNYAFVENKVFQMPQDEEVKV